MSTRTSETAQTLAAPEEVHVVTRRPDGTPRRPTTIWIVRDADRVFVRATNGRGAAWFRAALANGTGQVLAGRTAHEVAFSEAAESDLTLVDAAYRTKYRHYASIVDHLVGPAPRAATLEVLPA